MSVVFFVFCFFNLFIIIILFFCFYFCLIGYEEGREEMGGQHPRTDKPETKQHPQNRDTRRIELVKKSLVVPPRRPDYGRSEDGWLNSYHVNLIRVPW